MENGSSSGLSVEIIDISRIPEERAPQSHKLGFAYTIKISNDSDKTVQLLGRKWMIKHEDGHVDTVEGDGVVGQQPVIEPGGHHVYQSFCMLHGDSGSMWGLYFGKDEDENPVMWTIPKFNMSIENID